MRRPALESFYLLADPAMSASISFPQLMRTCDKKDQTAPSRDSCDAIIECASIMMREGVMTKNHPAAARQAVQRVPQSFAHPLVGHQPLGRNPGVTGAH